MKFIELFSGIGGFRSGFAGHECVFSSEIDKYARISYNAIYGDMSSGDIREIDAHSIPDHDVLTAGFPCQTFSIAGNRAGFKDDRGNLIYEIIRILQVKKPKYFLLENVKGLLSHDNGKSLSIILNFLKGSDYTVEYKVLNSKNFGVPQNRERVYIFGMLSNYKFHSIFNNTEMCYKPVKLLDILENHNTVEPKFYYNKEKSNRLIDLNTKGKKRHQGEQIRQEKEISTTITASHMPKVIVHNKDIHSSYRLVDYNNVCSTLRTMQGGGTQPKIIVKNGLVRRLTPLECWRLQGFTDEQFYLAKNAGISNTQLYKQAGNAVTVNVIRHLASEIDKVNKKIV